MEIVFEEPEEIRAAGWDDKRTRIWLVKCYPFGADKMARWFNVDPIAWKDSPGYRDMIKTAVRKRFEADQS
jgi:hypothetical protein